jgi:hypothetical protein
MFFLAKYNTQTTFEFPMIKRGAVDFAQTADWTPAATDSAISKDNGNVVDTTNTVAIAGGTPTRGAALWKLTLTATELQCAVAEVQIIDAATKTVEDQCIIILTYGHASAMIPLDLSINQTGDSYAKVDTEIADIQARLPAALVSGRIDASIGAIAANAITAAAINADAITAAKLAADVTTEVQSGLATATALSTAQSDLDDIQTRLPATLTGGKIEANVGSITDAVIAAAKFAANAITAAVIADAAIDAATFAAGAINAAAIADGAIDDAAVAADMDSYTAKIWVIKESTTTDHYAVRWFKNNVPITSGITSPTIQVIKGSDGTDLIASTALTEIGSTHRFKRDESTNKLTAGAIYFAVVSATIDSATRTFEQQIGRDSA